MNKKSDTVNSELRDKLFIVLALTGCISNIAGFTAKINYILILRFDKTILPF